jgi:hypothetical protein
MESFCPLDEAMLEWRSAGGMGRRYQLLSRRGVIAEAGIANVLHRNTTIATLDRTWRLLGTERRIDIAHGPSLMAKDPTGTKWSLTESALRLETTNIWGTDWQWMDGEGNGLIGFRQKGLARLSISVFLDKQALEFRLTPLLLGLGFTAIFEKASQSQAA